MDATAAKEKKRFKQLYTRQIVLLIQCWACNKSPPTLLFPLSSALPCSSSPPKQPISHQFGGGDDDDDANDAFKLEPVSTVHH